MGISAQVQQVLQADCLAGVWVNHNQQHIQFLQTRDVNEAIDAAEKIGADYLQQRASGRVVPDSFIHGRGAQHVRWFGMGFDSGNINHCATFQAKQL